MKSLERHHKRIGLVLSSVPGYSETFFRNKIKGLQGQGFEVILFVDYHASAGKDFPCQIVYAPDFSGGSVKLMVNGFKSLVLGLMRHPQRSFRLYRLDRNDGVSFSKCLRTIILNQFLLTQDVDWLHFGFGMLANGRENVAQALGARMAVSFRGFDLYLSPLKHPGCYNRLFQKEVQYHVLSQDMKQTLKEYGVTEDCIHVISPAIDTDFFQKENVSNVSSSINLITVARLHWKKGLEYTLEALAILKQKNIPFKYTIIGEGDQRERLIFAAFQLNILDHIHFAGKLSPHQVKSMLDESDIYLQYSIQEGFCNAVLEAQSMGLLCIVSNAEGLEENVLDTETGWVVPKRNPVALADKIMEVSHMSLEEKQRITQIASQRVKKEFGLALQNRAFERFYRQ